MAHSNFVVSSCCRIQNSKICFFSFACKTLIFAVFNFFSFRSGFQTPFDSWSVFARWSRSDPPHAAGTEDRGRSGFEVLEVVVLGYLKADRSVLLSRDSIAYISLCSNIYVYKSHLLQVLRLLINTFRHSFIQHMKQHFQFSSRYLINWFQNVSYNFTYQC